MLALEDVWTKFAHVMSGRKPGSNHLRGYQVTLILRTEHEHLAYCRLLSLWANEPEALFRRTEIMSFLAFSAVRSLYKPSHTQSRMD